MSNIFFSVDRVMWFNSMNSMIPKEFEAFEIIRTIPERNRYFVKSTKNIHEQVWVSGDDLEIDKQYYRNLKLEKLLNE